MAHEHSGGSHMTVTATTNAAVSVETGAMDLDTHFWQPLELWRPWIDPAHESAVVAFHEATDPLSARNVESSRLDPAVVKKIRERQGNPAVEDPIERLRWMDSEGLYLNVIFPYPAWFSFCTDPVIAAAGCRALNRWASAFAATNRSRLKPAALVPVLFPELAVEEFRYANEELGLDVVFAAPTPHKDRRWSDPSFEPLWSAMQSAGAVMMFHEFTRVDRNELPIVIRDCYRDNYAISYLAGHTVEAQLAVTDMIGGGALERFPELQVGFVEAHVAWLPGWLALMDSLWGRLSSKFDTSSGTGSLPLRPTDYFARQCTIVAFPDDVWVPQVIEQVGPQSITLCSDFPHPNAADRTPVDATFRATNPALPAAHADAIINGNARRIFRLG
jgi:predicted TIM-barrel fold metal-dependent hydrolase